jgi:hypothetical protein
MKNTIKIWSYIDGASQAIIPYKNSNLKIDKNINIDFSNVRSVNSSGIAITLVKLLPILKEFENSRWFIEEPIMENIQVFLNQTGIYNILIDNIKNRSLLFNTKKTEHIFPFVFYDKLGIKTTSFPLIILDYRKFEYRICVEDFIDNLIAILKPYCQIYKIKENLFLKLIKEIAKNSEDHTSSSAIFGMDIIENIDKKRGMLVFSFCDFGLGIHGNIKQHILNDPNYNIDASKYGIVDSYHQAYRLGFTTLKNNKNKGIGMSMILDIVRILNMNLGLYDARSHGFIPNNNSHEEIRRNFIDTGNPVGFYYYGTLNLIN